MSSSSSVEHVEGEVRALVQQRRVAFDDDAALHGVVDAVLAQHADAYLAGRGRPLDAADAASLRHRIAGFGALAPLLEDDSIEEIWINRPDRVFVARSGAAELTNVVMTADEVAHLVERMLSRAGRRLDRANPTQVYDIHATMLHLLGLDHTRLSFRNNGIDRRLTDVHGHVLEPILA